MNKLVIYLEDEEAYFKKRRGNASVCVVEDVMDATIFSSRDSLLKAVEEIPQNHSLSFRKISVEESENVDREKLVKRVQRARKDLPFLRTTCPFPSIIESGKWKDSPSRDAFVDKKSLKESFPDFWGNIKEDYRRLKIRWVESSSNESLSGSAYSLIPRVEKRKASKRYYQNILRIPTSLVYKSIRSDGWTLRMGFTLREYDKELYDAWKEKGLEEKEYDRLRDAREAKRTFYQDPSVYYRMIKDKGDIARLLRDNVFPRTIFGHLKSSDIKSASFDDIRVLGRMIDDEDLLFSEEF